MDASSLQDVATKSHRLYVSSIPSVRFVLGIYLDPSTKVEDKSANGREVVFRQGIYITEDPLEIALLDYEIAHKHPNIKNHADKNLRYVTADYADPTKQIINKARADLLQELIDGGVLPRDFGNYTPGSVLRPMGTSSATNNAVASNSGQGEPAGMAQRLAALKLPTVKG